MNNIFAIFLLSFLTSCCGLHTEVKYEYRGASITRIDKCGNTTFYYGDEPNENGNISVEYSGINDGFSGYLIFGKNGKVTFLPGEGFFRSKNLENLPFELDTTSDFEVPKGERVYEVILSTRFEIERNKETNTQVTATYNIDENEWW